MIRTDDPPRMSLAPWPTSAVRRLLERRLEEAGSQKELASRIGVTSPMISHFMSGRSGPGDKILRYLGMEARVMYYDLPEEETSTPYPEELLA